jgi:hypothetical protein
VKGTNVATMTGDGSVRKTAVQGKAKRKAPVRQLDNMSRSQPLLFGGMEP